MYTVCVIQGFVSFDADSCASSYYSHTKEGKRKLWGGG